MEISLQTFSGTRQWFFENRRLTAACAAAAIAISFVAWTYRRLQQADILPFDRWTVSLGWVSRPRILTDNLPELITRFSPAQLAAGLYTSLSRRPTEEAFRSNASTPQEWHEWLAVHFNQRDALLRVVPDPTYREKHQVSPDATQTLAIQGWATSLQQSAAMFGWNSLVMTENVFQAVRSSPSIAYTILFHVTAPFVAQKIWESFQDPLPAPLAAAKDFYMNHRISIALASVALVGFLFVRMKQEKGILKNLTKIWETFQQGHKKYDQVRSYRLGIREILRTIGKTRPGERGSNIIWYFQGQAHRTFGKEIGDALAELTAAGRIYDAEITPERYPQLKDLQIFEINLKEFITQHRSEDSVFQGWNDIMRHVAAASNPLVILRGSSLLAQAMFPEKHVSSQGEQIPQGPQKDPLADLITLSLEQGRFRCLLILDEAEEKRLKRDYVKLFTSIQSPDLTPEEQELICHSLYTAPGVVQSLPQADVHSLFMAMRPALKAATFAPEDILHAVHEGQRTWEQSWSHTDPAKGIQEAEKRVQEALTLKEQLLQRLWEERRAGRQEPLPVLQAVVMVEKILLPLYDQALAGLKKALPSSKQILLTSVQDQFDRFFGPCTPQEEARLLKLPQLLKAQIHGQDLAIEAISDAVYQWRKVPPLDGRPLVLFFAGPPGAGKSRTTTELAFQLNSVFGITESAVRTRESNMKRFNLNREKQGALLGWDVVKIQILEFIYDNPTSVIVFEEWDKMPDNEKPSLLELLEGTPCYIEGIYTRNQDRPFVERRCAIFVIVGNTASVELAEPAKGDIREVFKQDQEKARNAIVDSFSEARKVDGGAFSSRIRAVIPFRGISQDGQDKLEDQNLNEFQQQEVFTPAQVQEIRKLIFKTLRDGRKIQQAIEDAIFTVVRKKSISSSQSKHRDHLDDWITS